MVLLFHPGRLEGGIVISSRDVRGWYCEDFVDKMHYTHGQLKLQKV